MRWGGVLAVLMVCLVIVGAREVDKAGGSSVSSGVGNPLSKVAKDYFSVPKQETYGSLVKEQFGSYGADPDSIDPYNTPGITKGEVLERKDSDEDSSFSADGPLSHEQGGSLSDLVTKVDGGSRDISVAIGRVVVSVKGVHYTVNRKVAADGIGSRNAAKLVGQPSAPVDDPERARAEALVALSLAQIPGIDLVYMGAAGAAAVGLPGNYTEPIVVAEHKGKAHLLAPVGTGTQLRASATPERGAQWVVGIEENGDRGDVSKVVARLSKAARSSAEDHTIAHLGIALRAGSTAGITLSRDVGGDYPGLNDCILMDGPQLARFNGTIPVNVILPATAMLTPRPVQPNDHYVELSIC